MNRLDDQYKSLLFEVLSIGSKKDDRTGTGTRSVFGLNIKHDMSEGFPILTTKKVYFKGVVEELKWFLKGSTYAKDLSDKGVHIWDEDAKRNGREDTYLGPIYGHQWRNKTRYGVQKDQIKDLIKGLKEDPNSRRHVVSSWDVMDIGKMVLPPCHVLFQVYVADGKLSLGWYQRSGDLFLGVPFNISSYGLLLHLLCIETGYEPGELHGSFGDVHLYNNHMDQAKEQMSRESFTLPNIDITNVNILSGEFDVKLLDYQSHPSIKAPLST